MKVKDLKKELENYPDETEVYVYKKKKKDATRVKKYAINTVFRSNVDNSIIICCGMFETDTQGKYIDEV